MAPQGNSSTTRLLVLCVLFGIALWFIPALLYRGANPVVLSAGPPLGGEVSQAIGVQDNAKLLVAGKDYTLGTPQYFQNKNWVVTSVNRPNIGTAYVILQRHDSVYTAVLGPGTAFAQNYIQALPTDVVHYLDTKGLLYNAL